MRLAYDHISRLNREPLRLWLYGLGMLLPAVYFAWRYPLPPNSRQLTDLGKLANYGVFELGCFVVALTLMFGLYVLALRETQQLPARQTMPAVFTCGAALAYVMAWMYPVNAIDIFLYAVRSRLFTTYGANPLAAYPKDYPDDPWLPLASQQWAEHVSPYGPLWNLIAAPITWAAGDRIELAVVGFKLLAIASLLLGGWVIAGSLRETGGKPATGALLYLWNPLVLWEGIGNGHNDLVMAAVLLLALSAWLRRQDRLVIPLLVAATLIKYVAVLLIPLAMLAIARRASSWGERWRIALWSIALSGLVVLVSFYPFYQITAVIDSVSRQGDIFTSSPATLALGVFRHYFAGNDVRRWIKLVGAGLVILALAVQAFRVWKHPSNLARASFEVVFVFLLVATWNFRAWYLIWPLGLAALLPWGDPAWRMIAWTVGAMAGNGFYIWGEAWLQADFFTDQNIGVPLMFVPTVLVSLAAAFGLLRTSRGSGSGRAKHEAPHLRQRETPR